MAVEWYGVTTAQVIEHASRLRGIADDIRQASTAVEGVSVPGDGYGEPGSQFAKTLDGIAGEGTHTVLAAIVALEHSATSLKLSAEDYDRRQENARQRLRRAGEGR